MVFYHDNQGQHLHIAWYMPFCYVITVMEGPDKGLQELKYGPRLLASSRDSEIHNTYFIHFYKDFKIYSWDDYQRIVSTGNDLCSEIKQDTMK